MLAGPKGLSAKYCVEPSGSVATCSLNDNATGAASGTGAGAFEAARPVTRQEAAVLLLRTAELLGLGPGQTGTPPEDEAQIEPWALEAVRWVCSTGLMETETGRFRPEEGLTRQEGEAAVERLAALAG